MDMNKQALFCDGTGVYVIPPEPVENQKVVLRFRTAKDDVQEVKVVTKKACFSMEKGQTSEVFDYYNTRIQIGNEPFRYHFEIQGKDGETVYFNRYGVVEEAAGDL